MKKFIGVVLASLFAIHAQARTSFVCGYKDYFHLNNKIHPAIHIVSATTDQDVYLHVISSRSFEMKDTEHCKNGYAHVTVAYDNYSWCVLDIKDGPYMMHPVIHASCYGMQYKGISYDGFNSYSYTINLD
ncbi:hypothetical protein [Legionella fairfieldensis]|uniref:hypothetical protein n=1 Tax=Legionella fairfieldensis TaxID=45064 RepID=UPI00048F23A7|nr:hypothetical protein [Legionella fairfieldensis]